MLLQWKWLSICQMCVPLGEFEPLYLCCCDAPPNSVCQNTSVQCNLMSMS